MRTALLHLVLAAPLALVAMPAQAQTNDRFTTNASASIATGNYDKAERALAQQLRHRPDQPELLLNLAAVYSRTGRAAEARALYQRVLAQKDISMDLVSDRAAGSHAIARTGLRRLDMAQRTASN
jgi:Flp pilus assembly protein TadD